MYICIFYIYIYNHFLPSSSTTGLNCDKKTRRTIALLMIVPLSHADFPKLPRVIDQVNFNTLFVNMLYYLCDKYTVGNGKL